MSNKLSFPERRTETIEVQGQTVHLMEPTEYDMREYTRKQMDKNGNPNPIRLAEARVRALILCIVDESGERMYREEDIAEISQWPFSVTREIETACTKLIGPLASPDDLEDIAKN